MLTQEQVDLHNRVRAVSRESMRSRRLELTPELKAESEAFFNQTLADTKAAAEADPSHPSRAYFGLTTNPEQKPAELSPS
jgi:hypothetical protein